MKEAQIDDIERKIIGEELAQKLIQKGGLTWDVTEISIFNTNNTIKNAIKKDFNPKHVLTFGWRWD